MKKLLGYARKAPVLATALVLAESVIRKKNVFDDAKKKLYYVTLHLETKKK